MSNPDSSKRPATGTPGVKMLITTAALAATIGGWAVFTINDGAKAVKVTQPVAVVSPPPAQLLALNLPPLPTLVPPRNIVVRTSPVVSSAPVVGGQPPALREVSAPPVAAAAPGQGQAPASVTVTQSSR